MRTLLDEITDNHEYQVSNYGGTAHLHSSDCNCASCGKRELDSELEKPEAIIVESLAKSGTKDVEELTKRVYLMRHADEAQQLSVSPEQRPLTVKDSSDWKDIRSDIIWYTRSRSHLGIKETSPYARPDRPPRAIRAVAIPSREPNLRLDDFYSNKHELRSKHKGQNGPLSKLAETIANNHFQKISPPVTQILVIGHTDSKGHEAKNIGLGLKRACAVAGYLIFELERKKGQLRDSIALTLHSEGESSPLPNGNDAQNRRVEIYLIQQKPSK